MTFVSIFLATAIFAVILFFLCFLFCQALEPCLTTCSSVCCNSNSTNNWPENSPALYRPRARKQKNQITQTIEKEILFIHFLSFTETLEEFDDPYFFNEEMSNRHFHEFDQRVYQRHMAEAIHEIHLGLDTCIFITPEIAMAATVKGESFRLVSCMSCLFV